MRNINSLGRTPKTRTFKVKDAVITKQQLLAVDGFLQLCYMHELRKNFIALLFYAMKQPQFSYMTTEDWENLEMLWTLLERLDD